MTRHGPSRAGRARLLLLSALAAAPLSAQIGFDDVTARAGLAYRGGTWGASWGDFDGDGFPDLWVSNHFARPRLYLNRRDGTFLDVAPLIWPRPPGGDAHGAAWADFDRDGDQDLFQMVGAQGGTASGPNQLLVHEPIPLQDGPVLPVQYGGTLVDRAVSFGLDDPLGRGRTPLWLDFDRDGALDVLLCNAQRPDDRSPPAVFRNTPSGFVRVNQLAGFAVPRAEFAVLSDLTGDGLLDLVIGEATFPARVFDLTTLPFLDVTGALGIPATSRARDAVVVDFTGDLRPDVFVATYKSDPDAVQVGPNDAEAELALFSAGEYGMSFAASGSVRFDLGCTSLGLVEIFIGAAATNPPAKVFVLQSGDPSVHGIAPHAPGQSQGVYIGFDPGTGTWQVLHSAPSQHFASLRVQSAEPMQAVTPIGFAPFAPTVRNRFLVHDNGRWLDRTGAAGLSLPSSSSSVVAGDFDNDMDLDLYIVRTGPVTNLPNRLFENLGRGTFVLVPGAGGAEGSADGRGDSVAMADFDRDGFLDLFVANGDGCTFAFDGPHQLFRNRGNDNHWLQIDLQGSASNRDGIGARVLVTAGGVTQVREQGGGMHFASQDHPRLHFGLGANTVVNTIDVFWPSGVVQRLIGVPADRIITIVETP